MSVPYDADFAAHLRSLGCGAHTQYQYGQVVKRWHESKLSAAAWLAQIRSESSLSGGAPTTTATIYRRALLAWHRWKGLDEASLTLARVAHYRRPRGQRALADSELERLRAALERAHEPVRTLLQLLTSTGARRDELRLLRLVDVESARDGAVLLINGKGGVDRRVALPRADTMRLAAYLRGWRAEQLNSPWLFPSPARRDIPVGASTLAVTLALAVTAAGVPGRVTPHTLRHTVATRLAEAGVDPRIASGALGHTASTAARFYVHPGDDANRAALEKIR